MLTDQQVLELIERIVSEDFCEELGMDHANSPDCLTPRERVCEEKFGAIYRLAHSHRASAECNDVHENWRKEAQEQWEAMKRDDNA